MEKFACDSIPCCLSHRYQSLETFDTCRRITSCQQEFNNIQDKFAVKTKKNATISCLLWEYHFDFLHGKIAVEVNG